MHTITTFRVQFIYIFIYYLRSTKKRGKKKEDIFVIINAPNATYGIPEYNIDI